MSVTEGRVWFEALSTERTAASFTEHTGLQPTDAREIGDPVGNGISGRRMKFALWSLERECPDSSNPLDDALMSLLRSFDGLEHRLDDLRDVFELRIRCYGSTNSTQGGFWLGSEVMSRLGRLGVEFHCTVYLE